MKEIVIQFPFGVVAFDEQNSVIEKVLFPKKPQVAARSLMKTEAGKISDQTSALLVLLQKAGYDTFVFESASVASEVQGKLNVKVEVSQASEVEVLRSRMEPIAVETGL